MEPLEENLLSVRKPVVGRTHSLPNDSYMFLPLQPVGNAAPTPAQTQEPQRILGTHRGQSGTHLHGISFTSNETHNKCKLTPATEHNTYFLFWNE